MKLSAKTKLILCLLILTLLFTALCVRVPYGLDWTDEPYYSVLPYRLFLGDRPLVDTWEVHQLSGLLVLPFLKLFMLFSGGSTTGVMLYFRYVLIVLQFALSLYAFFVLRRKSGDVVALLAAGMLLMHVHFGINGLSYNAITPLLLALSVLFAFDMLDGHSPRVFAALSGLAYALAVQAYPYAALTLPVYILFWIAHARRRAADPAGKRLWRWFSLGALAALFAFAVNVLLRSPLSGIIENAGSILHDPDHQSESVFMLLASYCNAIRVLFGPVFTAAVALFLYSFVTHFVKNARARLRLKQLGFALAIALIAAAVLWVIPYDYPNHHKLNLVAVSITLILPSLLCLSDFRMSRYFLPIGLGLTLSLCVQLGSNTGVRSSSGMLLLSSVGTMLYLFALLDDEMPRPYGAHTFRIVAAGVCALQLALTAGLRVQTVYRDATLPKLTERIADGPAKGVVTTQDNAAHYAGVLADIREYASDNGNVLVTNLLPVAYLMSELAPATPSAFNMTCDSPWLAEYYQKHPERMPDLLYAANANVGQSNDSSLSGADALAGSLGLRGIEGRSGTIFID